MNRRVVVPALLVCAAPWLGGCQATDAIVDYFGPHADPSLASLAQAASADALTLEELDADAAALRAEQAEQLYDEIDRLCGRDEEGNAPRSCAVDREVVPRDSADVAAVLHDASSSSEENISSVPEESRALVVAQAIALAAWNDDELAEVPELTELERDAATTLLEWEYQQVYSLDFARSYVSPDQEAHVDELLHAHEDRILQLQGQLEKLGAVPQAAPAYDSPAGNLPTDADSARAFIDEAARNDTLKWTDAAISAEPSAPWQRWLIAVAAQSHRFHAA